MGKERGAEGHPTPLSHPEVSIAIVSYNTRDLLRRCLDTVATSGTVRRFEILVVDNASSDDTPAMLRQEYPGVRLLANQDNLGYSRAVNQAIRSALGKYVLILNPDIEVLPGSIDALAEHMDSHPKTGIAGGKLLNPDGTLQYSCRTFYTFSTLLHRRTPIGKLFPNSRVVREHLMMDWDHDTVREVDWMLGACMMVRNEAIREVGLMDERFFMYFEDVDWCYRMKQHAWKVVYVPDATMKHVHRRESARAGLLNNRLVAHLNSMFRFFDKWNTLLYSARKHRDLVLGVGLFAGDLVAVGVAFLGAFTLRALLQNLLQRPVFPLSAYGEFVLLAAGVVLFVNALLGLYRRVTARDPLDDAVDLAKGLVFSALVLMASTFLTRSELHSRFMVGVFVPLAFGAMITGRFALASFARALRERRFGLARAVVMGETGAASELAAKLETRPELGYEVVVTLSDRPGEEERRFRAFWDADGIRDIVHRHRVAEVLLVKPTLSGNELARLLLLCRRDGVRVRLVSGVADFLPSHLAVSALSGRPVVDLLPPPGGALGHAIRRMQDTVIASVMLLFLGPVGWVRALRRPPEPTEPVHGHRGRVFERAATVAGRGRWAEDLGHVIRGDLALVGPKPRAPKEVEGHEPLRVLFDLVPPGVTGLWRIHEAEGLDLEEEVSLSLSALQNQSPVEDLKILLRTLGPARNTPLPRRRDR